MIRRSNLFRASSMKRFLCLAVMSLFALFVIGCRTTGAPEQPEHVPNNLLSGGQSAQ